MNALNTTNTNDDDGFYEATVAGLAQALRLLGSQIYGRLVNEGYKPMGAYVGDWPSGVQLEDLARGYGHVPMSFLPTDAYQEIAAFTDALLDWKARGYSVGLYENWLTIYDEAGKQIGNWQVFWGGRRIAGVLATVAAEWQRQEV